MQGRGILRDAGAGVRLAGLLPMYISARVVEKITQAISRLVLSQSQSSLHLDLCGNDTSSAV